MWLIGKLDVGNKLFNAPGMHGEVSLNFNLPRKLRRRHKVKIRYFGYHSGRSGDNPDIGGAVPLSVIDVDTVKVQSYQYRKIPSELRIKVKADGENIMFDNVSVMSNGNVNTSRNTDYLSYPTTKTGMMGVLDATHPNLFAGPIDWPNYIPVGVGSSTMQDLTIGSVDQSVSKLEVVLEAKSYNADPPQSSGESNIRMDSVTVVLQLI